MRTASRGTPRGYATVSRMNARVKLALRLVVDDPELRRGRTETLTFRIVDEREVS